MIHHRLKYFRRRKAFGTSRMSFLFLNPFLPYNQKKEKLKDKMQAITYICIPKK
jgi:hypothetical protein